MTLGPVMLDLTSVELDAQEREILCHPAVGGVILFARNFESPEQIAALTAAIHKLRDPHLLVAVDQEGGRVQRFRRGFTQLPPAGRFGALSRSHPVNARRAASAVGWLMAAELRSVGVDFSFAPVLDLNRGVSRVIGDRAFADGANAVSDLAWAWTEGVHAAGMAAVGKHFPGHGGVAADSHEELPTDGRSYDEIEMDDLVPFQRLIYRGLEAVMPAHVVYPKVDPNPAGFSAFWLRRILRERLGFQGVIFSDDLNMAAAAAAGGYAERARSGLDAGCDVLLVCNNRPGALEVLESLRDYDDPTVHLRCLRMHGRGALEPDRLHLDPRWHQGVRAIAELEGADAPSLDL
ncbi:MAG: beta-N-acetylhexosaminidase [Chromatiaceae bacterium]|nr:beta-N-acetylhexosaminidase [Chromatiaceae bacterium]